MDKLKEAKKEYTPLFGLKKNDSNFEKKKIHSAKEASNFIKQFYHEDIEIYESFFILLLNRQNQTIGYAKISQGGVASTTVDTKIVAKYCVESLASAVILAHNHPSGALKPSQADINITKKIQTGLELFDCNVLDHVILTSEGYYSLSENGDM